MREPGVSGFCSSCASLISPYSIFQHFTFTQSAHCIQTVTNNLAAEIQVTYLNFSGPTLLATRAISYGFVSVSCTKASGGQNLALALLTKVCAQARKAF